MHMSEDWDVVAASGTASNGEDWLLLYRPEGEGGRHHMVLLVDGGERSNGSGFDIPDTTEIGFGGGLAPGQGNYYLHGLVTNRIRAVRAESHDEQDWSEVATTPLPAALGNDGDALSAFVIVRPPVDDVTALVGLDQRGRVIQRIAFPGPPNRP